MYKLYFLKRVFQKVHIVDLFKVMFQFSYSIFIIIGPFYIVSLLYKMGQDFFDIQYKLMYLNVEIKWFIKYTFLWLVRNKTNLLLTVCNFRSETKGAGVDIVEAYQVQDLTHLI